ncbi:hypothetical protein MHU86_895 [Fragilaria crotonensis]|nr:hypothetical protein MHU86_895 [Fragilaria crotonensis]
MTSQMEASHTRAEIQNAFLIDEEAPASVPSCDDPLQQSETGNVEDDDDDSDDMTIIGLDHDAVHGSNRYSAGLSWIEQEGPAMEERRRNVLLRELQRVQRASFIHFVLLCMIPTVLLFIVFVTVLGDNENCTSTATTCREDERTFLNAFTTRCICDAIDVKGN